MRENTMTESIHPFLLGLGTGGSLIIAIGAQNAFVLSQGVRKNHYIIIPLICFVCDALLISVGVTGTGTLIAANPTLGAVAAIGGAVFLAVYGFSAFRSAARGGSLKTGPAMEKSLKTAVLTTLAVTLLNPHVYIDTVILLGGIAGQFEKTGRIMFGAGACLASVVWFFSLSLGGKALAPVFARPAAWRILDTLVGLVMWGIALSLIRPLI